MSAPWDMALSNRALRQRRVVGSTLIHKLESRNFGKRGSRPVGSGRGAARPCLGERHVKFVYRIEVPFGCS